MNKFKNEADVAVTTLHLSQSAVKHVVTNVIPSPQPTTEGFVEFRTSAGGDTLVKHPTHGTLVLNPDKRYVVGTQQELDVTTLAMRDRVD